MKLVMTKCRVEGIGLCVGWKDEESGRESETILSRNAVGPAFMNSVDLVKAFLADCVVGINALNVPLEAIAPTEPAPEPEGPPELRGNENVPNQRARSKSAKPPPEAA